MNGTKYLLAHLNLVEVALGLARGLHSCGEGCIIAQHQQPSLASGVVIHHCLHVKLHPA